MAAERKTGGMAPLPQGLFKRTAQAQPTQPESDPAETQPAETLEAANGDDVQSRGDTGQDMRTPKPRRRRQPVDTTNTRGRKLHLTEDVHDRLWQMSRQRKTTVSALANELLDRALPRFRVEREG